MEPIEGHATLTELDAVAVALSWMDPPPCFFGASVLPLYLDVPGVAAEARPTEDVDAIVQISASLRLGAARIEAELRSRGWTHDLRSHRRGLHAFLSPGGIPVDFVFDDAPADAVVDDWPLRAARVPATIVRPSGLTLRIPTSGWFLACKIAASRNPARWTGPYDSKDIEDIALLLCGCTDLAADVSRSTPALKHYVATWASEIQSRSTTYGAAARELLLATAPRLSPPAATLGRLAALSK